MKKFSDFAADKNLDGDKIKVDKILNQEIVVVDYRVTESRYKKNKSGKCLHLQIRFNDENRVVFSGSDVLIEQMEKYGNQCPFKSTIRKINNYYSFT